MKLSKMLAIAAVFAVGVIPMTAQAATTTEAVKPAGIEKCSDKQGGLDLNYFMVKDIKNVPARHAINRAIINSVGDLIMEHKHELETNACKMTITPDVRYNDAGILSATFTSEGVITGAAHGFKSMKSINYSYLTGEEITAKDINKLYKAAKEKPAYTKENITSLLKKEAKDGKLDLITGFKGLKTEPPFYMTGKDLDIYAFFQPYEVAPYAAGIVTVKVD